MCGWGYFFAKGSFEGLGWRVLGVVLSVKCFKFCFKCRIRFYVACTAQKADGHSPLVWLHMHLNDVSIT